jgi:hypothetical protein
MAAPAPMVSAMATAWCTSVHLLCRRAAAAARHGEEHELAHQDHGRRPLAAGDDGASGMGLGGGYVPGGEGGLRQRLVERPVRVWAAHRDPTAERGGDGQHVRGDLGHAGHLGRLGEVGHGDGPGVDRPDREALVAQALQRGAGLGEAAGAGAYRANAPPSRP